MNDHIHAAVGRRYSAGCPRCQRMGREHYAKNRKRLSGEKKLRRAQTPLKERELIRARRAARRALVDDIKMSRGCADCGYREHPAALQFDHVRGVKVAAVSTLANKGSKADLFAEIAKCEVVCANCHSVRTSNRRPRTSVIPTAA